MSSIHRVALADRRHAATAPRALLLAFLATCALPALADLPVPGAPKLDARSYILVDHHSGRELAAHNADERMEPASLTKLMSAYAVFHALQSGKLRLDDAVTISERAWKAEGSRTFVQVGTKVRVEVLIQGMIVQSGNDATIALAERVGGSEETFAELMNGYAQQLGMTATHFTNSTGLPAAEHYTTARDIARLGNAIVREFPQYYRWYSQREFTWNNIRQSNRNGLLLRDASVDGMKTGHTESAGYCLVTSAKRDGMRLVSVVLGTKSERARESASQALLNYGFSFFETRRAYRSGIPLAKVRVWKADESPAQVALLDDLWVTVPRGQSGKLRGAITLTPNLAAPVASATSVGELRVLLGEEVVASRPLHPMRDIAEGGLWTRALDSVWLWFQ